MYTMEEDDVLEMNIGEVLYHLIHKFWIIILAGVVCAIPVLIYMEFFSTPVYTSTTSIYIYVQKELSTDYALLATTTEVVDATLEELQLGYSSDELRSRIRASVRNEEKVVDIFVSDSDPELAKTIADTVRDHTMKLIEESRGIEHMRVLTVANVPTYRDGTSVKRVTVLFGGIGSCIAMVVIVLWVLIRRTICTPEEVTKYLGLETLGMIPFEEE